MNVTPVFTATQAGGDCRGNGSLPWPVSHPEDGGTLFAYQCNDSGPGGLYRSTNYGRDWSPVMAGLTDT
jgi:hypothetical protein